MKGTNTGGATMADLIRANKELEASNERLGAIIDGMLITEESKRVRLAEAVALAVHWKEQAEQTQGALNEAENMNAAATAAVDATHQLPQENNAADSAEEGRNKNDSP